MKIRNLLVAILAMSGTVVFAQEQRQIKEEGKTVFKPHWFIQAQVGAAHTVGEAKFTDLMSPAAAINIGYKFAPAFGARIGGSGWQAKGGWVTPEQTYQYKYLQGNIDIMAAEREVVAYNIDDKWLKNRLCSVRATGNA